MKYKILAVDDQVAGLHSTKELLESWGYGVDAVTSGMEGLALVRNPYTEYAVILLDYDMPGMNGIETAIEIKKLDPDAVILVYSCIDDRDVTRETFRTGIFDFIDKNESIDDFKSAIKKACAQFEESRRFRPSTDHSENQLLLASLGIVGRSSKMAEVGKNVIRFGSLSLPLLIIGETGSGKELVAKAAHVGKTTPYHVVNCGGLNNSDLIESELFGYEKGAFTGANQSKAGILETSRGGTVFLDEIHQLSPRGQTSLLRAIREKKIRRVGSNTEVDVSCRIIAAAKPEIREMYKDGRFLPDLYYRLMFQIDVPPLRERKEDIELLVDHFCRLHEKETGIKKYFRQRTIRYLEEYHWPGNVGELSGIVYQLLALAPGNVVEASLLESDIRFNLKYEVTTGRVGLTTYADLMQKQEQERREYVANVLRLTKSKRHAADRLEINESTLRSLVNQLKIPS